MAIEVDKTKKKSYDEMPNTTISYVFVQHPGDAQKGPGQVTVKHLYEVHQARHQYRGLSDKRPEIVIAVPSDVNEISREKVVVDVNGFPLRLCVVLWENIPDLPRQEADAYLPIENEELRRAAVKCMGNRVCWQNLIHKKAEVNISFGTRSRSSPCGCYFSPFSMIEAGAQVGDFCFFAPHSWVRHDTVLEEFSNVIPK